MKIYIVTIFPGLTEQVGKFGIVRRAIEAGKLHFESVDLRNYTTDSHRSVDDSPFGGGPGMVFLPEPVFAAVEDVYQKSGCKPYVVYLSPQGELMNQRLVDELAGKECLVLIAGRYEGIDQRVLDVLVDKEISFGDYILSGGELPAMALVDAIARKIPGALGNEGSHESESFSNGLLDFPNYTRPDRKSVV